MPKTSIQFHTDPDEAADLAARWARDHNLVIVVEQFFPEYRVRMADDDRVAHDGSFRRFDRVSLCRGVVDLSAASAHDFVTRNPGCLFFSIGPRDGEGLRESLLGGATDDRETFDVWKRLIKAAKAEMHLGATVRNPYSEARDSAPRHLHTKGAHDLAKRGVKMLAAAGWNEFVFDDCGGPENPSR